MNHCCWLLKTSKTHECVFAYRQDHCPEVIDVGALCRLAGTLWDSVDENFSNDFYRQDQPGIGNARLQVQRRQLKRGPQRAFIKDRCLAWAPVVTNAHSVLGKVYMAGVDDIGMDLLLVTEPRTRIHESYCELVCHALVDEILSDGDLVGRLQEFVERIDAQVTVSEDYTVESMCSEGHGAYELPQADSVVVDKVKGVFLCIHWLTLFYFKIICTVHDRVRSISRGLGEVLELSARTCDAVLGALVYGPAKSVALERWVVNPGGEGMTIHLLLSHKEEKEDATDGLRWALLDVTENFPELPVGYHAVLVFDSAESLLKAEAMETSNTVMKLDLGSLNNDGESTVPATARDVHPVIPSATPREAGELVVENVGPNEPRGPDSDGHRSREGAHHCEEGSPAARRQPSAEAFEFPLEELQAQTRPDLDEETTLGVSVVPVVPQATKEPSLHSQRAAASGSIRRGKYKKPHDP